ncbi:hypothetical protein OXPF_02350 [Oxobacter pfennigii]|uniref:Metal-binding protein n=1 Tax=Oxobacter pfennigii TaxID=36849 RepID=A0A0P8WEG7_9CLOT|nr:DUF2284 domain-containing protein [Oxobacter pfennigii]KPU46125.1 hypothetical protein OXPF_02350 [Oxobacter pfennigii]
MMKIEEIIFRERENFNIHEYAFLKPADVIFSDEVRMFCEKNGCGMHGTSWACPPATGSVAECRKLCNKYKNAFIFSSVTKLESSYDIKGWRTARITHEAITDKVVKIFRREFKNPLILSTEGCTVCKKCSYPDNPCRFPDRMYPATEGFGILVMQQASLCNMKYNNGPETVTYFSMVFF